MQYVTEHGLARGRAVHATIALECEGRLAAAHPECMPYLESFRLWRDSMSFVCDRVEYEVRGSGYVGHPDFYGTINGRRCLLDWKGGAPADWHPIQTALYERAMPSGEIDVRGAVYLHGDGRIATFVPHRDRSDFAVGMAAVSVASWKIAHGLAVVERRV